MFFSGRLKWQKYIVEFNSHGFPDSSLSVAKMQVFKTDNSISYSVCILKIYSPNTVALFFCDSRNLNFSPKTVNSFFKFWESQHNRLTVLRLRNLNHSKKEANFLKSTCSIWKPWRFTQFWASKRYILLIKVLGDYYLETRKYRPHNFLPRTFRSSNGK